MSNGEPLIRDMDLVRALLIWAARFARTGFPVPPPLFENHSPELVDYTIRIMHEKGLHRGVSMGNGSWRLGILTWEGQDFLQAASDESIWNQAKQKAGSIFNSLTLDLLLLLLKQTIKDRLGLDL